MFKNFITSVKNTMSDIKQIFKFDKFEGVLYVLGLVAVFAVIVIALGLTGSAGLFILNTLFGFTLAYCCCSCCSVVYQESEQEYF